MIRKIIVLVLFVFIGLFAVSAQKIKVACVGNSVTHGAGIKDRDNNSYPVQLQELLGNEYEVKNFGYSGATMLKNGHKPYWEKPEFKKSQDFKPNIVIIHLGLNDQGNNNWPEHKEEFIDDYIDMITVYRNLTSKPKVIICKMSPTLSGHHWFEEGMRENFAEIQSKIDLISQKSGVDVIDLHEPLFRFPEYFPDNIHPTKEGAEIIAQKVYSGITGNYGGLKLPILYGENMVIQRKEPIILYGLANSKDEISISFQDIKETVKVGFNGTWQIELPAMRAGGPYRLTIGSKLSQDIMIEKVFIGEVWLASGQSNMAFTTKRIKYHETILKDSINPMIHLFNFQGKAWPGGGAFDKEELESCNATSYFNSSGWKKSTSETVENYSAIAYAFAFNLQKELDIPIGIIDNSVGGSTTQSWISRESMELNHQTIDLLNDTYFHPMVMPWVNERKAENFSEIKKYDLKVRHPFDPTFLFDAGINPIKNFNIKGVIWYQGESNAERPIFHSLLFESLVSDWRMHWKKPKMPFYYVQLSSLNRSTWGEFRDSQRKLLEIPFTGMAISSDVGNPKDVHPKNKWIVGERLSKIALSINYNKNIAYSGPLFDYVNVAGHKLKIRFKFGEGLGTSNSMPVKDIQVAGADKVFKSAKSEIVDDVLEVWSNKVPNPRFVKYGYTSFTNGNLINKYGLPASTFSNILE